MNTSNMQKSGPRGRSVKLCAALALGLFFLASPQIIDDAWAVMEEKTPEPQNLTPQGTNPQSAASQSGSSSQNPAPSSTDLKLSPLKLDLPVSWQLTRSKLVGPGASTLTETFRETWTLEITPTGRIFLQSPRARVPAYAAHGKSQSNPEAKDPKPEAPRALVLSEQDLGRLVGIKPSQEAGDDDSETAIEPIGRPITVNIIHSGRNGLDVSLSWSEEEHYALHLDVGTSTLF